MKQFAERTAVVTGGASGIGLGIARAFARAGMNVAILDIRADALEEARAGLERLGAKVLAVRSDVSDPAAVEAAAETAARRFGAIHVAVNNAGVALHGKPIDEIAPRDWDWIIGVNVLGVVNGVRAFLPRIRQHGEGGHIVNTASIGGLQVRSGWNGGAYSMTKYAVVALSESLDNELKGSNIGVSVLCPGAVRTRLDRSAEARPPRLGGASRPAPPGFLSEVLAGGADPDTIGERVLRAIRDGEFFVFTDPAQRGWIEERHRRIMDAFDRA